MPEMREGLLMEGESPASLEHRMRYAAYQVFLQSLRIHNQPQGCSHQAYAARAPEIAIIRRNASCAPAETHPDLLPMFHVEVRSDKTRVHNMNDASPDALHSVYIHTLNQNVH